LLVEEDDSLRDILREVLQASEKAVQAYGDSQEANQALKKLSFDVVITDLGLKKGPGRGVRPHIVLPNILPNISPFVV
jgi:DNA-binding response OmpR family regulator